MQHITTLLASVPLAAALGSWKTRPPSFDAASYAPVDVLRRDVAVIGGGSSGTFAAIHLRDMGYSVTVVERDSTLGGQVDTYIEPTTGTAVDYGVQRYWNTSVVTDFFDRLEVPIIDDSFASRPTIYVDFKTGQVLDNFSVNFDFTPYATNLARYPELAWSWNLPDPLPEELLIPFREFIERHNLQDIAFGMLTISNGLANPGFLDQVTVNMLKWLDNAYVEGTRGRSVTTAAHNNGELYANALGVLGSDVLLRSTVEAAQRLTNGSHVSLVVQTPTGSKLIEASKLLVTIPPLMRNMLPFDLGTEEQDLFGKFQYSAFYSAIVNNTGLRPGTRYMNVGAETAYNIPELPGIYSITPSAVDGIYYFWYGGPEEVEEEQIRAEVTAVIRRLTNSPTQEPYFIEFSSHTPFKLVVDAETIQSGFHRRLHALQGLRNTWYTGAAFNSHGSGPIWNYTYHLLPSVVDGIRSSDPLL
jgi:hypothetical protein